MATSPAAHDSVSYRVILVEFAQCKLLLCGPVQARVLPRVLIPRTSRRTDALRAAIRAQWDVPAFVVDYVGDDAPEPCVLAEFRGACQNVELRAGDLDKVRENELSEHERTTLEFLLNGGSTHAVSRLGWIDDAISWVENATGRKVPSTTGVEQFNAGGGFALLRFRVEDGQELWLKATEVPHTHEFSVTALLSELAAGYLPKLIASKPEWNAWLMASAGTTMGALPAKSRERLPVLQRAVESMAELQTRTVGHAAELRCAGAFDQKVEVLASHSRQLFDSINEAMDQQTSTRVPPICCARFAEVKSIFDEACGRMAELDLPETIIHGDLNMGNLLTHDGVCRFIDWSEAYVGNPLVSLQHLLLLNQTEPAELKEQIDRALVARYGAVIERVCDRASLDEALIYMPLMAAASALYGRGGWLTSNPSGTAPDYAYARSVARHMDRAARKPALLNMLSARSGFGSGRASGAAGFTVPVAG